MISDSIEVDIRRIKWLHAASVFEAKARRFGIAIRAYNPEQPREPAGTPAGGRWTRIAQNSPRGRGTGLVSVGGRLLEATPAQEARLIISEAQAREAVRRVQELDPKWRPSPSISETVEGAISTAQAEAREAQLRLQELGRMGIGPGPFAGNSIPARGSDRNFTASERERINSIGLETGCHTCGTTMPETSSGNFIPDHQPPNSLNRASSAQRLYPQCNSCSMSQGGWISYLKRKK